MTFISSSIVSISCESRRFAIWSREAAQHQRARENMLMRAVCFKWPGFHGLSLGSAHHTLKPERCRRRFGKRSWSRLSCISWKTCMNDTRTRGTHTHMRGASWKRRRCAALRDLSPQTGWPAEVTPRAHSHKVDRQLAEDVSLLRFFSQSVCAPPRDG